MGLPMRFDRWTSAGDALKRAKPGKVNYLNVLGVLVVATILGGIGVWMSLGQWQPLLPPETLVSGELLPPTDKRPVLICSYREASPDLVVYSEERFSGPLRAVTEEAASRVGHRIQWVPISYSKSVPKLETGEVDMIPFVFNKTPERAKVNWFSTSLGLRPRPIYFVVHKNPSNQTVVKSFEDLRGHTIGIKKGSYYFAQFMQADYLNKVDFPDEYALAAGFALGKVEIMITKDKKAAQRTLIAAGYNEFEFAEYFDNQISDMYYFYTKRPERAEVMNRFDQALQEMKATGVIDAIYQSYETEPPLKESVEAMNHGQS